MNLILALVWQIVPISANLRTMLFILTEGDPLRQRDIVKFIARAGRVPECVAVRVPQDNDAGTELLTQQWMQNRAYDNGNSYYEIFYFKEFFTNQPVQKLGTMTWKIKGPLPINAKIVVQFKIPKPFDEIEININDLTDPKGTLFHVGTTFGATIAYGSRKGEEWTSREEYLYPQKSLEGMEVEMSFKIRSDRLHGTVNGFFHGFVMQEAPDDNPSEIKLIWRDRSPVLENMFYTRN